MAAPVPAPPMLPAAPAWAAPPPPPCDAPAPGPAELEQPRETNEAASADSAVAAGQRFRIMTTPTISLRPSPWSQESDGSSFSASSRARIIFHQVLKIQRINSLPSLRQA